MTAETQKRRLTANETAEMESSWRQAALHSWIREASTVELTQAIIQMARELDERNQPEPPF